jgi:hypothetical protein
MRQIPLGAGGASGRFEGGAAQTTVTVCGE